MATNQGLQLEVISPLPDQTRGSPRPTHECGAVRGLSDAGSAAHSYYSDVLRWLETCGVGSSVSPDDIHGESYHEEEAPVILDTVVYIVCAVIFNDHGEVLLIQEAKPSCKGAWYLPAGKVERNEPLHEAIAREVLEEAGVVFDATDLILVESQGARWHRFTYAGILTGEGTLKTTAQGDDESLQAAWFPVDKICEDFNLYLRSCDIIKVIRKAVDFRQKVARGVDMWRVAAVSQRVAHRRMVYRLLVVSVAETCGEERLDSATAADNFRRSSSQLKSVAKNDVASSSVTNPKGLLRSGSLSEVTAGSSPRLQILLRSDSRLPVIAMSSSQMYLMFTDLLKDVFDTAYISFTTMGILAVEHQCRGEGSADGLCMTLLMSVDRTRRSADLAIRPQSRYRWLSVEGSLYDELKTLLSEKAYPPVNLMS